MGSSPNMTGLSLLTQGDWAEGTTAHNGETMAAPLVLMGDTCNRIRVRTPGGDHMGRWYTHLTPHTPPSVSCPTPSNLHKTVSLLCKDGCLPTMMAFIDLQNVCRLRKLLSENFKYSRVVFFCFNGEIRHFCCAWIHETISELVGETQK